MNVFPLFYFPPISYFVELIKNDSFSIEINENFVKQTYRNRCYILGANDKLMLNIPLKHTGIRIIKDIEISYDFNWQKEHIKSFRSAYKSSPYYEYYEDEVDLFYTKKEKYLIDFNLNITDWLLSKIAKEISYTKTNLYQNIIEGGNDYRNDFNVKQKIILEPYDQVFMEKIPFVSNLSILDLLCSKGPQTIHYLKKQIII